MAKQMKASRVQPQPRPRALNSGLPASGRMAPRRERRTVLAAMAEAAYMVKESTR